MSNMLTLPFSPHAPSGQKETGAASFGFSKIAAAIKTAAYGAIMYAGTMEINDAHAAEPASLSTDAKIEINMPPEKEALSTIDQWEQSDGYRDLMRTIEEGVELLKKDKHTERERGWNMILESGKVLLQTQNPTDIPALAGSAGTADLRQKLYLLRNQLQGISASQPERLPPGTTTASLALANMTSLTGFRFTMDKEAERILGTSPEILILAENNDWISVLQSFCDRHGIEIAFEDDAGTIRLRGKASYRGSGQIITQGKLITMIHKQQGTGSSVDMRYSPRAGAIAGIDTAECADIPQPVINAPPPAVDFWRNWRMPGVPCRFRMAGAVDGYDIHSAHGDNNLAIGLLLAKNPKDIELTGDASVQECGFQSIRFDRTAGENYWKTEIRMRASEDWEGEQFDFRSGIDTNQYTFLTRDGREVQTGVPEFTSQDWNGWNAYLASFRTKEEISTVRVRAHTTLKRETFAYRLADEPVD